jgi:hypothetical protein
MAISALLAHCSLSRQSALSFTLDTSAILRGRLIAPKHEQQTGSLFWRQIREAENHDLAIVADMPRQHDQTRAIEVTP